MSMERRKDLRKEPKRLIDNNVTYQTVNEYPVITGQGTLLDISEDGCRVGGPHTVRKGLRVQLAVEGEPGQPSTILMNCQVAWIKEKEFGVQFVWS
jgi:PilZ domain-containing protein